MGPGPFSDLLHLRIGIQFYAGCTCICCLRITYIRIFYVEKDFLLPHLKYRNTNEQKSLVLLLISMRKRITICSEHTQTHSVKAKIT